MLEIQSVRAALARMKAGEASAEVLAVIVDAAEAYAAMRPEYGLASPQPGLTYATNNEMLVETMRAARPETVLLHRVAPAWEPKPTDSEATS